jgi:hypothetical protein
VRQFFVLTLHLLVAKYVTQPLAIGTLSANFPALRNFLILAGPAGNLFS